MNLELTLLLNLLLGLVFYTWFFWKRKDKNVK